MDDSEPLNAIFVDGYRAVSPTTNNLLDHVHLWDSGCEALAEEMARELTGDPRFQALAERVRHESLAPPTGRCGPPPVVRWQPQPTAYLTNAPFDPDLTGNAVLLS